MNNAVYLLGSICILLIPEAESSEIACPKRVTGTQYGKVTFQCYYSTITRANMFDRKFCCVQGLRPGRCRDTIVSDRGYMANRFMDRITLDDNQKEGIFTVTISGLEKGDEDTYICGIGKNDNGIKDVINLLVVEDSSIMKNTKLVYSQLRGTVIFNCDYKELGARKYLCKVTKNDCIEIIDSLGKTDPSYEGRVTANKQKAGTLTVKMVQVQVQDARFYTCGSDNPEESKDSPIYDVRINEETNIPQGSRMLTPRLGGSLSAQCNYNPEKKYTEKFWCKVEDGVCNPIIKTNGDVMDAYEGRAIIYDNSTSGLMQVLMNGISSEDEGWYWCVLTEEKHDQTTAVQVRISEENLPGLTANKIVQVIAGAPVNVICSYTCRYKTFEKYWCRWSNHGCEPMSNVEDTQDSQSVTCQTEKLIFTITSASQEDSGVYWCGVKHGSRYGENIAVRLIVQEPSRDVSNTNVRSNFAGDSRNAQEIDTPPSTKDKSSTTTAVVVSVGTIVLVVCAVFLFLKLRKRKNSDLVSIGSYRTNISMSDLDHNIGKDNPGVTDPDLKETDISRSEDSPKTKKKESRENLDYCFLINHVETPNEQVVE